jgi:hypothetical protein
LASPARRVGSSAALNLCDQFLASVSHLARDSFSGSDFFSEIFAKR